MAVNSVKLRKQLEKAISIAPTPCHLKRDIKTPDGMNGYTTKPEQTVVQIDGYLDDSPGTTANVQISEGGRIYPVRGPTIMLPYREGVDYYEPKKDDYFSTPEKRFVVLYAVQFLKIYWELSLEAVI